MQELISKDPYAKLIANKRSIVRLAYKYGDAMIAEKSRRYSREPKP